MSKWIIFLWWNISLLINQDLVKMLFDPVLKSCIKPILSSFVNYFDWFWWDLWRSNQTLLSAIEVHYFHQSRASFGNTKVRIRDMKFWTEYIEDLTSIVPTVKKTLKSINDRVEAYGKTQERITSWKEFKWNHL